MQMYIENLKKLPSESVDLIFVESIDINCVKENEKSEKYNCE